MELVMILSSCFLNIVIVILIIIYRPRASNEITSILSKIQFLQSLLEKFEASIKEDFKLNRAEISNVSKDNRFELNNTLKDFKLELASTLKNITESSQTSLNTINKTLELKIDSLITKLGDENRSSREDLSKLIKEFSMDQKNSYVSFEKVQKELADKTVEQLDKTSNKVEEKLLGLTQQAKVDNREMRDGLENSYKGFQLAFDKNVNGFSELQKEKFAQLELKQKEMIDNTEIKLNQIKVTVEEKLEKTLSERLGQSFETVGKQLIEVQKGLGEMQTLAQDVGGLKRVLSNVKMRGGIGEVQLAMLLEQILAPDQYQTNVKTKINSNDLVEFAIKLPGKNENQGAIWLPIDAKFPKDVFEQLQNAYDQGDPAEIEKSQKYLENTVKNMAKDISDKYLDPPNTTDFGILFLPFEGIFAEVVRKASLLDELHRKHKIIVTGPTTLAAILNSLQMGFKTLAIEKRSSEVWQVLGAIKKEFENFGGLLEKAQGNIQTGLNQLDDVMGKRTRAIQKKLRSVESLSASEASFLLPDIQSNNLPKQDDE